MSQPVVEYIVDDIVSVLGTITTVNGYHQDLLPDRPSPSLGNRLQDCTALVYLGQRTSEDERPQQYSQYLQIVTVRIHVAESEQSDVPIDQRLNLAASDVERALCETEAGRQRDGWAIDTWPDSATFLPSTIGSNEGDIEVDFVVQYRTTFGNPYESPHRS